jgi:hypothetical protein
MLAVRGEGHASSVASWLALTAPLWAPFAAVIPLSFVNAPRLVQICNISIGAQVALTIATWLVLTFGWQQDNFSETPPSCPNPPDVVVGILWFSSSAAGAIALASAVLAVLRRRAGAQRILGGLLASGLSLVIFVQILYSAFCGWN